MMSMRRLVGHFSRRPAAHPLHAQEGCKDTVLRLCERATQAGDAYIKEQWKKRARRQGVM